MTLSRPSLLISFPADDMLRLFHAILAYSLSAALLAHAAPASSLAPVSTTNPNPATTSTTESRPVSHTASATASDTDLAIPVAFTLTGGNRFSGTLTRWNESTIDGTFGERHWIELIYRDAWRILHRLIDRDIPDDWLLLARVMLLISLDQPEAERWAERAFRHALRVAGDNEMDTIEHRIDDIRSEYEAKKQARIEREQDRDPDTRRARTPEADDWPSTPWPDLSRNEQRNAVLTKKDDAKQALGAIDLQLEPIETATALLYTDLDRPQAVRIAMQLDAVGRELAKILHTNPNRNPFWGKAVLIVLSDRAKYDSLQSDGFGFIATPGSGQEAVPGRVHPIGPKVFITLHHPGRVNDDEFELELTRLLVRATLHRHISPRRLPPWANDGLGMLVADRLHFDDSSAMQQHRREALAFLRTLNHVDELRRVFEMTYADAHWPALERRIAALGGLFVELMVRSKPRDFVKWVEAVKRGGDWRETLDEVYGVTLDVLLDTTVRYYRVND